MLNSMNRQERIRKAIEDRIYANGGHWAELIMKNGKGTLKVQRLGKSSFERLYQDSFNVYLNRHKVMSNAELGSVANYIIELS